MDIYYEQDSPRERFIREEICTKNEHSTCAMRQISQNSWAHLPVPNLDSDARFPSLFPSFLKNIMLLDIPRKRSPQATVFFPEHAFILRVGSLFPNQRSFPLFFRRLWFRSRVHKHSKIGMGGQQGIALYFALWHLRDWFGGCVGGKEVLQVLIA